MENSVFLNYIPCNLSSTLMTLSFFISISASSGCLILIMQTLNQGIVLKTETPLFNLICTYIYVVTMIIDYPIETLFYRL